MISKPDEYFGGFLVEIMALNIFIILYELAKDHLICNIMLYIFEN